MELTPVKAKDIPVEQSIFNRAWLLLKMYGNITEKDDIAWKTLVNDVNDLWKLGKDEATERLSKAVALGLIDYLEEKSKQNEKGMKGSKQ